MSSHPGTEAPSLDTRRRIISPAVFVAASCAVIVLLTLVIWAVAGFGYFWPGWAVLGCAAALAPFAWLRHLRGRPSTARTRILWHLDISASIAVLVLAIWAFTGTQGPWPLWTVLGLALLLGLHVLVELRAELPRVQRRELEQRVDVLSRTRRQSLDAQAAELRRIERDLHDGAQARLVALSMQLGRAEASLAHEPHAAELVRAARDEATLAIRELRDLARGIAPPMLADRGLIAAVHALADRSGAAFSVADDTGGRLPPAVENAAYFVVAEALTNSAKHAAGAQISVSLTLRPDTLVIDVGDDGAGGADPDGSGLRGLRVRIEALDGTLTVDSPAGGPTRLHAELPCA